MNDGMNDGRVTGSTWVTRRSDGWLWQAYATVCYRRTNDGADNINMFAQGHGVKTRALARDASRGARDELVKRVQEMHMLLTRV